MNIFANPVTLPAEVRQEATFPGSPQKEKIILREAELKLFKLEIGWGKMLRICPVSAT